MCDKKEIFIGDSDDKDWSVYYESEDPANE